MKRRRANPHRAAKLDAKIWEKVAPIQAHRVKKALGLGDDVGGGW